MRQHDVGAWLVQETWEEGDEFDVDVYGYHIFRHNAVRGNTGRQHLFRVRYLTEERDYAKK